LGEEDVSLRNRTILITRPKEQAGEFIHEVEKRGGRAVLFPSIQIHDPESWHAVDTAIARLESYDGILFTSANAAHRFVMRCTINAKVPGTTSNLKVYAVGEKTKKVLEDAGWNVEFIPGTYSAETLADCFHEDAVHGKSFLFPCGDLARDELPTRLQELHAVVDRVVVYETTMPDTQESEDIQAQLHRGDIDVVTFASPSAATNFFKLIPLQEDAPRFKIAVIGLTTAEAVRNLGVTADIVAKDSTITGMVEAIDSWFD
jgi:uroporphyrinogen-III synthase